jgi:hypothetical protein
MYKAFAKLSQCKYVVRENTKTLFGKSMLYFNLQKKICHNSRLLVL